VNLQELLFGDILRFLLGNDCIIFVLPLAGRCDIVHVRSANDRLCAIVASVSINAVASSIWKEHKAQ
jgi:hypothetical protein